MDGKLLRQARASAAALGWTIKDDRIGPLLGFKRGSVPLAGSRAELLDQTGKRVTLTRVATLGLFALAAKKSTGSATVVVASPEGMLKGTTKKADKAWQFVMAYNALVGAEAGEPA